MGGKQTVVVGQPHHQGCISCNASLKTHSHNQRRAQEGCKVARNQLGLAEPGVFMFRPNITLAYKPEVSLLLGFSSGVQPNATAELAVVCRVANLFGSQLERHGQLHILIVEIPGDPTYRRIRRGLPIFNSASCAKHVNACADGIGFCEEDVSHELPAKMCPSPIRHMLQIP